MDTQSIVESKTKAVLQALSLNAMIISNIFLQMKHK